MRGEFQERRIEVNGLSLNYLDYGGDGKPPLLFLHGGSAHAHWWDFVAPAFTDEWHALSLDQRGHGDSQWTDEWAYGSRHYVSDLERIIEKWGLGAPVLVGHSMGGHNILLYAAEHSANVRAAVVIDTLAEYGERAVNFLRAYAEKEPRRFASLDEAAANFKIVPKETLAGKEVLEHIARHSYRLQDDGTWVHKFDRRTLIREPLNMWDGLARVACPTLVVKIKDSFLLPREAAEKMAAALPHGRFVEIENSYHHVMLDNPPALIEVLRQFLSDL
jgi:pimeloyl-ACP methyl ester carboxylesterase